MNRYFSPMDYFFCHIDLARKTLFVQPTEHQRHYPAQVTHDHLLTDIEKKHAAGLMRVNHTGEVCAQALYQGQAITARSESIREKMQEAADEELDHLAWCNQRLSELNSYASYLNLLWYLGSLSIGIIAGCIGDKWNLGFLAETEEQVVKHLESHLGQLPENDVESRAIVAQMCEDEAKHRDMAREAGAHELPYVVKKLMALSSKIMTRAVYYF